MSLRKHPAGERVPFEAAQREVVRLKRLAELLDSSISIPGTNRRIGVDPLVGLLPGVGDWAMGLVSTWIVWRAKKAGAPRRILVRMLANVGLEVTVGVIPLFGDAFDAWFKANEKNVRMLERHVERRARREEEGTT